MTHHLNNPSITVEEYTLDREVSLSLFLAGTMTTKENGATRFCPGSHIEASEEPPSEDRAIYAEMEPGDALIIFSSVYHAGSANLSQDEVRLVFATFMNRGILRTGENQYLTIPPSQAATLTDAELTVCGYAQSQPSLGFVEFMDPMAAIRGEKMGKRYDIVDQKVLARRELVG